MSDNNPYATPKAEITPLNTGEIEFNESKWYSFSGRIGRLRYLAYPMFSYLLSLLVALVVVLVLSFAGFRPESELASGIIGLIVMIPMMIFGGIIYPIRRLNDLGKTGWLVLIMLIPIVNILFYLYLLFGKGDAEENEYGNPPRPNKWYHWILALVMPTIAIIGILAALALPAYQDYTKRANAAKIQAQLNAQSFEQEQ